MTSIVFVHGIANRGDYYANTLDKIISQIERIHPGANVIPCHWAAVLSARFPQVSKSIPAAQQSHELNLTKTEAIWAILEVDPLAEVRELETAPSDPVISNAPTILSRFQSELNAGSLQNLLGQLGLELAVVRQAISDLSPVSSFRLLSESPCADPQITTVIVRAILSMALIHRRETTSVDALPGFTFRQTILESVVKRLCPQEKVVTTLALKLALSMATPMLRYFRQSITTGIVPFIGDVMTYQAHGDEIEQYISATIDRATGPVYLLAHSLGGVACVDLLCRNHSQQVKGLVTVGSQAGFFLETGVLRTLRRNETLPPSFPKWLNIYDPNDFLSFLAKPLFGNVVRDEQVNSRQPFPSSHLAYWDHPDVWRHIADFLK